MVSNIFKTTPAESNIEVKNNGLSKTQTATTGDNEKYDLEQEEYAVDDDLKKIDHEEGLDYSGVKEKTDPVEIALVRKLDRYIMPTRKLT